MQVILREEPDASSRTGVSVRAYYASTPPQSLHIGGETYEEAKRRVKKLYPQAIIQKETKEECGCKHKYLNRFDTSFTGLAGESLVAVYDNESEDVVGFGSNDDLTNPGHPVALRFEKVSKDHNGFSASVSNEVGLSNELQALYASSNSACKNGACLPWLRVQKDPNQFRAALHAARKIGPMKNSKAFYRFTKDYLMSQDQEVFIVLLLDVHGLVRGISEISRGARDRVLTPVPDVLRIPLVDGATAFVVAHNHPSGSTKPSDADKEVTKAIKQGADSVNLLFLDHVIIGDHGYYSFADHNLIK